MSQLDFDIQWPNHFAKLATTNLTFINKVTLATSKGKFFKNPVAEQHNSPQGCTVRVKAALDKAH
jgi:hypothetical protein